MSAHCQPCTDGTVVCCRQADPALDVPRPTCCQCCPQCGTGVCLHGA